MIDEKSEISADEHESSIRDSKNHVFITFMLSPSEKNGVMCKVMFHNNSLLYFMMLFHLFLF